MIKRFLTLAFCFSTLFWISSSIYAQGVFVAPDTAASYLSCYHPTAQFRAVNVIEEPWDRGWQYGAEQSALMQIFFAGGFTNQPYVMMLGVVERDGLWRTIVLTDNAPFPPNPNCSIWHGP